MFGVNQNFQSIDLTAAGAPGCFIHSDEVLMVPLMTTGGAPGKSGSVMNLKAGIPNNSKLKGVYFRTQLWVRDPRSRNLLLATFTNGIGVTIQ